MVLLIDVVQVTFAVMYVSCTHIIHTPKIVSSEFMLFVGYVTNTTKDAPYCPHLLLPSSAAEAEEDDKDEGDYTDGTTGDSGFADARPFLKVDLEDSPQHTSTPTAPSYYKALRRKEVGDPSYYKVANREARTEMWQGT